MDLLTINWASLGDQMWPLIAEGLTNVLGVLIGVHLIQVTIRIYRRIAAGELL